MVPLLTGKLPSIKLVEIFTVVLLQPKAKTFR